MKSQNIFKGLSLVALFVLTQQSAYAACTVTGMTGTGGEVVSCIGTDTNGYTGTPNGDDVIVQSSSNVSNTGVLNTIVTANGGDTITVNGGTVSSGGIAIAGGAQNDDIVINSGTVTATDHAIEGGGGNDTITVNGGSVTSTTGRAIRGRGGDDTITLNGGVITGNSVAINPNAGSDTVVIGGNVTINGSINGGNNGSNIDILKFSVSVFATEYQALSALLAAADPAAGSITINGFTYTWLNFENIENALGFIPVQVPTLSEWALYLLMALLALFGFHFSRKQAIRSNF